MFFEEGWASLADVTAEVFDRTLAFHAKAAEAAGGQVSQKRVLADVAISVWDMCDAATKAGVTGVDGSLVPASKLLLAWDDPRKLWNSHVDLRIGTVGSGAASAGIPPEELRARYGPFMHLPLAIPLNGVQSSMSFLEEELRQQGERDEETLGVAAKLIAAAESGRVMTRLIARQSIAATLSRRKFKIAWALASDKRPELQRDVLSGG